MWILIGVFMWFFVGCAVLAAVDHKDKRLFKWASSCPILFGYELVVMAWPYIAWKFR